MWVDGLWGAGVSEAGTLDANVSQLSPSGGRLAGPEELGAPHAVRLVSLPLSLSSSPSSSARAVGWGRAGPSFPLGRFSFRPSRLAPAPVPLINLTICSSAETLPSFSLTSDRRLGDTPPVGCALRASSAAPRFPRGAHMYCFRFFKKAHRLPSSRFTRRGESGLGSRQSAEAFFVLASVTSALVAGAPCSQTKGVELRVDTLQPFHGSRCCPGSSGLGLLGFEY